MTNHKLFTVYGILLTRLVSCTFQSAAWHVIEKGHTMINFKLFTLYGTLLTQTCTMYISVCNTRNTQTHRPHVYYNIDCRQSNGNRMQYNMTCIPLQNIMIFILHIKMFADILVTSGNTMVMGEDTMVMDRGSMVMGGGSMVMGGEIMQGCHILYIYLSEI